MSETDGTLMWIPIRTSLESISGNRREKIEKRFKTLELNNCKNYASWIPDFDTKMNFYNSIYAEAAVYWHSTNKDNACAEILQVDFDKKKILVSIHDCYKWIIEPNKQLIAIPRMYDEDKSCGKCYFGRNDGFDRDYYPWFVTFDIDRRVEEYYIPFFSEANPKEIREWYDSDEYAKCLIQNQVFWGEWSDKVIKRINAKDKGMVLLAIHKIDISDHVGIVTEIDFINNQVKVRTENSEFIDLMDVGKKIVAVPRATRFNDKLEKIIAFDFRVI